MAMHGRALGSFPWPVSSGMGSHVWENLVTYGGKNTRSSNNIGHYLAGIDVPGNLAADKDIASQFMQCLHTAVQGGSNVQQFWTLSTSLSQGAV
jgi:hypothetical protein